MTGPCFKCGKDGGNHYGAAVLYNKSTEILINIYYATMNGATNVCDDCGTEMLALIVANKPTSGTPGIERQIEV